MLDAFNLTLFKSYYHYLIVLFLYTLVNAPKYDMIADANSISPIKFLYCFYKNTTDSSQRFYSPPRPCNKV
jgi:hypothetical protein